jgi:hypothetical protein
MDTGLKGFDEPLKADRPATLPASITNSDLEVRSCFVALLATSMILSLDTRIASALS